MTRSTTVMARVSLWAFAGGMALSQASFAGSCDVDFGAGIDAAMDSAISDSRIVGGVVMVMKDGKLVYHRAAGLADREAGIPMSEDAIFRLSSVSKSFVTAAAMALVEQGKIGLDDPVTKYLPDFQPALADGTIPVITVRQLADHTAGLGYGLLEPADGPYHQAGVSDGMDEVDLDMAEEMKRISAAGLGYAPGTSWAYSVGVDVLGAVVEAAYGKPLQDAVRELVTEPLGISDAGFSTDSGRLTAAYYNTEDGAKLMADPQLVQSIPGAAIRFSPGRARKSAPFPSGGGGMVATAEGVLHLLDTIRAGGGPILKAETTHEMMTNQIGDLPVTTNGPGFGFGLGGAILTDPAAAGSPQSPGTWSWGGVYGHSWFVDPVCNYTVVELTNTGLEGLLGRFTVDVRNAIYGAGN